MGGDPCLPRLQSSAEEILTTALRTSLEWHLDGVEDPSSRWLALQEACRRLEHHLATTPALATGKALPSNHALITSALRRAAQELEADMADVGFPLAGGAATNVLN